MFNHCDKTIKIKLLGGSIMQQLIVVILHYHCYSKLKCSYICVPNTYSANSYNIATVPTIKNQASPVRDKNFGFNVSATRWGLATNCAGPESKT